MNPNIFIHALPRLNFFKAGYKNNRKQTHLINIPRVFNGAIFDLAENLYIPQKFYFNEYVVNILRDVIGILIFDLRGMEAVRGQKHPSEAKNGMRELIY